MPISEKNAARAVKMVGLDQPGPMHVRDYDALVQKAAKLADFLERMDHLDSIADTMLPDLHWPTVKPRF